MFVVILLLLNINLILSRESLDEGFCISGSSCSQDVYSPKFILYDVNESEGFNLKRDVYIRMAIFIKELSKRGDYHLVLPPWYSHYHWRSPEFEIGSQNHLPWNLFFDIPSLQAFAPVVEFSDFLRDTASQPIDRVFVLQHISNNFETLSEWTDGWSIEPCHKETVINYKNHNDIYSLHVLGYNNITAKQIECISFHGGSNRLSEIAIKYSVTSILFHHAEVALHNNFGDSVYWQCRRSMRFSSYLVKIATKYREKYLNSTNELDKTELPLDWRLEKLRRTAVGGPYLAVHLRRRDFIWGRPKDTPNLSGAAKQILGKLKELDLKTVFVATDAPEAEFEELKSYLDEFTVLNYKPSPVVKKKIKDGGIAIIDQIICSYARYFIGSFESTFSFRIQEEREIIGFKKETTFNRFCGDSQTKCVQPTKWTIVY